MRTVWLLGHPVSHSLSPRMQNAAFRATAVDAEYRTRDVLPADLPQAIADLRATDCAGANVTLPHKLAAAAAMDEISTAAVQAGAVNTIVNSGGRLVGHNTDIGGLLDAVAGMGLEVAGRSCLVLGSSGAAAAAIAALLGAGADVTLAARDPLARERLAERFPLLTVVPLPSAAVAELLRRVELVVNATSAGLDGESNPLPDLPPRTQAHLLDMVYAAIPTPLVRGARAAGWTATDGLEMLICQGARAFQLWTGLPAPVAEMRRALGQSGSAA